MKKHWHHLRITSYTVLALLALTPAQPGAQAPTGSPGETPKQVLAPANSQQPTQGQQSSPQIQAPNAEQTAVYPKIAITAGRSSVLDTDFDVKRIAITNPAVADVTAVQPRELLIDAKSAGTVSLIVWGDGVGRRQYDVVVQPAITALQQRLQELFPGEDIQVSVNDEAMVLSGNVSSTDVMLKAGEIAKASASKANVVNLLQVPGGTQSQQVMLQVRFAEVNRRALTELGVSLFTGPTGYNNSNVIGRTTTQQFAAPDFDNLSTTRQDGQLVSAEGEITFSDFLNIFVFSNRYNIGALVHALKSQGYFQSLAEPNLIAYNGQEASFLAGGEIPVPMVQGVSGAVNVQWREFGIQLKFVPTIAGDTIRLHVAPEVSSLDFNNGITLQGFRIPALTSRKASTDVELRDGQSFAIAGLLDNISQTDAAAVPLLSQIPIIGNLFKSKAERQEQTELMVLITPHLVQPLSPDEVPPLPTNPGRWLPGKGIGGDTGKGGMVDAPQATASSTTKKTPIKK
jgi:pilus assembly protein CpaC